MYARRALSFPAATILQLWNDRSCCAPMNREADVKLGAKAALLMLARRKDMMAVVEVFVDVNAD